MAEIPPNTPGRETLDQVGMDPRHPMDALRQPGPPSPSFAHQTPGYFTDRPVVDAGIRLAAWVRERPDIAAMVTLGVAGLAAGLWLLARRRESRLEELEQRIEEARRETSRERGRLQGHRRLRALAALGGLRALGGMRERWTRMRGC